MGECRLWPRNPLASGIFYGLFIVIFAIVLRTMKFSTVVEQVLELLQRQKRISYRALKREFDLDDEYIDDLKAEIIDARRMAVDEDGKVLVWIGASPVSGSEFQVPSSTQPPAPSTQHPS